MGRTLLSLALGLALSGCWMSEEQFFGPGDWAHLDFNGSYTNEDSNGHAQAEVELATRPDGLIEGTSTNLESGKVEHSLLGMVQVAGGSGKYYILVDRSEGKSEGELYLLGHVTSDGGLEMYFPQCGGTPDIKGMKRETPDFGLPVPDSQASSAMICTFTSKAALQNAALEAERFLSAPHIVEVNPLGKLTRRESDVSDESGESGADTSGVDGDEDWSTSEDAATEAVED